MPSRADHVAIRSSTGDAGLNQLLHKLPSSTATPEHASPRRRSRRTKSHDEEATAVATTSTGRSGTQICHRGEIWGRFIDPCHHRRRIHGGEQANPKSRRPPGSTGTDDLTPLSAVGENATGEVEEGRRTLYFQPHRCRHLSIAARKTNSNPTYSIYTTRLQIRGPHSLPPPERPAEGARTRDLAGGEQVERYGFFSPPQSGERGGEKKGMATRHRRSLRRSKHYCFM
jgi:hypothetical protein